MFKFVTVVGFFCWFGISTAHAGLITIDWSGKINSSPGSPSFEIGDSISGAFVYDNNSPLTGTNGTEDIYATNHSSTFSINGVNVFGSGGTIGHDTEPVCVPFPIYTCVGLEQINIESSNFSGDLLGGLAIEQFTFGMGWINGGGPSGSPLPSNIFRFPEFSDASIFLQGTAESIRVRVTDLSFRSVSSVPSSATAWLLGSALLLLRLTRPQRELGYQPVHSS